MNLPLSSFLTYLQFSLYVSANLDISDKVMKLRYCAVGNCAADQSVSQRNQSWTSTGLAHRRWIAHHRNQGERLTNPNPTIGNPVLNYLSRKAKTCSMPCQLKPLLLK